MSLLSCVLAALASPTFLLTSLLIVASPGTGAVLTIVAGLQQGRRAALTTAWGCTLGIVPHLALSLSGVAGVLRMHPWAFELLRGLGVLYLLFLAWQSLAARGALALDAAATPARTGLVRQAVLANLLNPKLSLFFLAFLPQFVQPAQGQVLQQMLGLSLVFMAMTWIVFALYGVFAAAVRVHLLASVRAMAWLRRGFAAAFALLAARLMLSSR
ncbi:LysE family translocator [Ideonella sp. B508-1]|uniref:LysE family translocator n=1 Tax=Ideonella sp. B508-1 TaxID=137716 RepID=UPI00034A1EBD|nr:LysE family translocator [Ideonella sp. B508-1]